MADDHDKRRAPMNTDTAMLLLAFVALAIGCLILSIDLFSRRLPAGLPPT